MVDYMLLDGVTDGRISEVMSWRIGEVEAARRAIGRDLLKRKTVVTTQRRQQDIYRVRARRCRDQEIKRGIKQRVRETGR